MLLIYKLLVLWDCPSGETSSCQLPWKQQCPFVSPKCKTASHTWSKHTESKGHLITHPQESSRSLVIGHWGSARWWIHCSRIQPLLSAPLTGDTHTHSGYLRVSSGQRSCNHVLWSRTEQSLGRPVLGSGLLQPSAWTWEGTTESQTEKKKSNKKAHSKHTALSFRMMLKWISPKLKINIS